MPLKKTFSFTSRSMTLPSFTTNLTGSGVELFILADLPCCVEAPSDAEMNRVAERRTAVAQRSGIVFMNANLTIVNEQWYQSLTMEKASCQGKTGQPGLWTTLPGPGNSAELSLW